VIDLHYVTELSKTNVKFMSN